MINLINIDETSKLEMDVQLFHFCTKLKQYINNEMYLPNKYIFPRLHKIYIPHKTINICLTVRIKIAINNWMSVKILPMNLVRKASHVFQLSQAYIFHSNNNPVKVRSGYSSRNIIVMQASSSCILVRLIFQWNIFSWWPFHVLIQSPIEELEHIDVNYMKKKAIGLMETFHCFLNHIV